MKKNHFIKNLCIALMLFLSACSAKEVLIDFKESPTIYIVKSNGMDTSIYSFALKPTSVTSDTIYLPVQISGKLSGTARNISLVADDNSTALANVHYKLLSYRIEPNQNTARLPIVIYRTQDLKLNQVLLKLRLVRNENFNLFKENNFDSTYNFLINDVLSRPTEWGVNSSSQYFFYFGAYSRVKYQLIINATGKYDFIDPPLVSGEWYFYKAQARNALISYNNANPSNPLRDENGALVTFPN